MAGNNTSTQPAVRLGIIGLGNMGAVHARKILDGEVTRCELTTVCDGNPDRLRAHTGLATFTDSTEMIRSGKIDALLIATPHYSHTTIGVEALRHGLHVLIEKPISVHKADCERLLAAHQNPEQIFGAVFNQRTDPFYQKIRQLVRSGELGELRRINWIATNWFRTEAYYAAGGWRATWAGEGGGVLLNQCPHNLDLFQWMFGMPARVRAFCQLGRYHNIEVEDDVTAYFEFASGTTAVFITSTGESPGTNRLEVTGERGRLVYENNALTFLRNEVPMSEFSRTTDKMFDAPPRTEIKIPLSGRGGQHVEVLQNFVDAILDRKPLIAPAADGIRSVELANAILLSSFQKREIDLPLDAAEYEDYLKKELVPSSRFPKKVTKHLAAPSDFAQSFGR